MNLQDAQCNDKNTQGECLIEYLGVQNSVLLRGNEPTFAMCNRKEVTDLTVETDKMGDLVSKLGCI